MAFPNVYCSKCGAAPLKCNCWGEQLKKIYEMNKEEKQMNRCPKCGSGECGCTMEENERLWEQARELADKNQAAFQRSKPHWAAIDDPYMRGLNDGIRMSRLDPDDPVVKELSSTVYFKQMHEYLERRFAVLENLVRQLLERST